MIKFPEWNVETAPREEALLAAFDAAGTSNLRKFDRLISILDKYPEFLNAVQEGVGHTLAYRAAEANNEEIILYLGKLGAKVDVRTREGLSPLHIAASRNHVAAVDALIELGADINLLADDGPSLYGNSSALDIAAQYGAEGVVKLLLKHHAKLDAHPPESSNPAIHFAMRRGWEHRARTVKESIRMHRWKPEIFPEPGPIPATGNAVVIELLVNAGADLKGKNYEGDQPLHVAIQCDQLETVKVLLAKYRDKIDLNGRGQTKQISVGYTPLMTVVNHANRRNTAMSVAMIELLKEHGADLSVKLVDHEEFTPTAYELAVRDLADPTIISALLPKP